MKLWARSVARMARIAPRPPAQAAVSVDGSWVAGWRTATVQPPTPKQAGAASTIDQAAMPMRDEAPAAASPVGQRFSRPAKSLPGAVPRIQHWPGRGVASGAFIITGCTSAATWTQFSPVSRPDPCRRRRASAQARARVYPDRFHGASADRLGAATTKPRYTCCFTISCKTLRRVARNLRSARPASRFGREGGRIAQRQRRPCRAGQRRGQHGTGALSRRRQGQPAPP
jgi:hypothetical protein